MLKGGRTAEAHLAEPAREVVTLDVALGRAARTGPVAALLFGSGLCALVYQVAWLRELRLVFGASTAASAAVLAIFMGGLGAGALVFGRRADRSPRPLALYATLELAIAASAALTPVLLVAVRGAYVAAGGAGALGLAGATLVRLGLAALVLAVPTMLMGGTLPAAARAVEHGRDDGRRRLAALYGANTLGAVAGALLSTFVLVEVLGTRRTLWAACLVNALVGLTARSLARTFPATAADDDAAASEPASAPPRFVLAAAFLVGAAFFLMELVWYRELAPLLSGSSFTFGLILAVALAGVGLGGGAYALRPTSRPPTLAGFATSSALEALALAIPFALGDRVAYLAAALRSLAGTTFGGLVVGWAFVAAVVVLPAAIVAGYQFPMLIALLGRGGERVGRHVGLAYSWNTIGAIAGSLAGGFGVLPLLSANGTWMLVTAGLGALAVVAALAAPRTEARAGFVAPLVIAAAAFGLLLADGPTAAWRHSPIGAGRAALDAQTPNALHDWANRMRRTTAWAVDGVESSVALNVADSDAFIVNGKSDGSARGDAGTQVMFSTLAAILHGAPRRSLVVGLGTGSSAGWLAAIPSMERVDVVELEPAIVEVARRAAAVNHDALDDPKVHVVIGDAREVVLTSRERYDLIVSEPSNPYRAGVASLFTSEFYDAVARRLAPGGVFAQWVQAYEVDARTIATVYATLATAFPEVQTWQTLATDLVLIASAAPIPLDVTVLRDRIREEPYRAALSLAWRADDLEGFLARYVATPAFARRAATTPASAVNTDDRTPIEFGFARSAGRVGLFDPAELRAAARAHGEGRPAVVGSVDWTTVDERRMAQLVELGVPPVPTPDLDAAALHRAMALRAYAEGRLDEARTEWERQPREPASSMELALRAESLADAGDARAVAAIERLRATHPLEAELLLARLEWRQHRADEATERLAVAFERHRTDPWPAPPIVRRALGLAERIAVERPAGAERLFAALAEPFAVHTENEARLLARMHMLPALDFERHCRAAFGGFEPHPIWERSFLAMRIRCYAATGDARLARAERDLDDFLAHDPEHLTELLAAP
jgi:spermidine synthase